MDISQIGPGNETNTNFVLVSIIRIVAKSQTDAKSMTMKALTSQKTISPILDNLLKKEFNATAMTNWVRTATGLENYIRQKTKLKRFFFVTLF